jgi:hypothetical protein
MKTSKRSWSNAPEGLKFRSLKMSEQRFRPLHHRAVAYGLFFYITTHR